MADLWDDAGDASEFALPGDEQLAVLVEGEPVAATEDATDEPHAQAEAPAAETEAEATGADEAAEELIYGKFKSKDDVVEAYPHLEQELGRLRSELGDARRLAEERLAGIEQRIQQPQPQPLATDVDWDALAFEQPLEALRIAAASGDARAYGAARAAVEEAHPGFATLAEQQAAMDRQMRELGQQIQETREPVVRSEKQAIVTAAYKEVAAEFPDFDELTPAMNQVVQELAQSGYDWITPALESGNPEQAKAAWRQLALSARGLQGANLAEVAREAAREHVAETDRAKRDAVVASASTTVTPAALSVAEQIGRQWAEIDAPFKGGDEGWNI